MTLCAIAFVLIGHTASGQPAIALPDKPGQPKVPILKLGKDPDIAFGQTAVVKGTVDAEGLKYSLASLSILQPVTVMLVSRTPADDLKLTLYKKDWKEPRRAGSTGAARNVTFSFRTEGGVNILVQSDGPPRPFYLIAWAGDELHPSMKDVIVTPAEYKALPARPGGGAAPPASPEAQPPAGPSRLPWMIAGALAVAVVVLLVVVFRRGKGGSHA